MSRPCKDMSPSLQELHAMRVKLTSAEFGQLHLFEGWPSSQDMYTAGQRELLIDLIQFARYYPGGVEQYIRNGRSLLAELESNQHEFVSLRQPSNVYTAPSLFDSSEELHSLEKEGMLLAKKTVFVLVAGGLGERLGYSGIKLDLPVETATRRCYLQHYLAWVKHVAGPDATFVIMTSGDTHARTQQLLKEIRHGVRNVHVLKQGMVFCFADAAAHLAVSDGNLIRKPHGHGDVHSLLHQAVDQDSGRRLVEVWLAQGYSHIVFLQDTNATATLTIPVSLAISARHQLAMNFTCIPRKPKEAIGLLCNTRRRDSDVERVVNIEYNKFESLALSLTDVGGDCAAPHSSYSPFPGSINTLLLNLTDYVSVLTESSGAVPEFMNPKYTDDAKTVFKPCRIESLMQDIALLFNPTVHRVGATVFTRFTYQAVKNSLQDGIRKALARASPCCAATGEEGFYEAVRRRLCAAGLVLSSCSEKAVDVEVGGAIALRLFPIIIADVMAMGASLAEISERLLPHPENVKVSERSVLLIEGRVRIESLDLDGALHLVGPTDEDAPPLVVRGMSVKNSGWTVRLTHPGEDVNEVDAMRGFIFEEHETQAIHHAKL